MSLFGNSSASSAVIDNDTGAPVAGTPYYDYPAPQHEEAPHLRQDPLPDTATWQASHLQWCEEQRQGDEWQHDIDNGGPLGLTMS